MLDEPPADSRFAGWPVQEQREPSRRAWRFTEAVLHGFEDSHGAPTRSQWDSIEVNNQKGFMVKNQKEPYYHNFEVTMG